MFDSLIIGALTTLILGGFYYLFKKATSKTQVYVQNGFLIVFALLLLIVFFLSFSTFEEFPTLLLPMLVVVIPGEFLIIKKLLKNWDLLHSDDFKE